MSDQPFHEADPNTGSRHEHENKKSIKRNKGLGRIVGKILGREKTSERKETAEQDTHSFTLKVNGETQIAQLGMTHKSARIDEMLLHPEPGTVSIVTRPNVNRGETSSHVFRVLIEKDTPQWVCDKVKPYPNGDGYDVERMTSPMTDFQLAQSSDEKTLGLFADISLPEGSQVLLTRQAEIPDIQAMAEAQSSDTESLKLQAAYQRILDAVQSHDFGEE